METISLTLPDVVIGRLRDQVARGVHLCEDDAASEAIRQMVEARYRAKVEAFHEALALGIAKLDRGEVIPFDPDEFLREDNEELDRTP